MPLKKYQEEEYIFIADQEMNDRARRGLLSFTLQTKPDYEVNWHHRQMCMKLNRFLRREIRFLMVFMPPRHGKSELTSRRLPAMIHGMYPDDEIMAGSYSGELASDMCRDAQRIMETEQYRSIFPYIQIAREGGFPQFRRSSSEHEIFTTMPDGTVKRRGRYRCGGVGGAFTGRGANWLLIDDPIKGRQEADSASFRKKVWIWWQTTLFNRLEKEGSALITMTRWHEDDLAGRLLKAASEDPDQPQWEVVSFPAIKETEENPNDPRKIGEALWPSKYDETRLLTIKKGSGTRGWTALYQQRPTALEGGIIKKSWLRYWTTLPLIFNEIIQSWDLAFKDNEGSYVVGGIWGRLKEDYFLIDQYRERVDFIESCNAMRMMTTKHPKAMLKLVEDAANGPALISSLKHEISGIVPVRADVSKIARLNSVSPAFESGNVYLPDPSVYPWVNDYIEELVAFPNGADDDQVDQTTQALLRFRGDGANILDQIVGDF